MFFNDLIVVCVNYKSKLLNELSPTTAVITITEFHYSLFVRYVAVHNLCRDITLLLLLYYLLGSTTYLYNIYIYIWRDANNTQ